MSEKVYYLDEARDKYAQVRKKSLENKDEDIIYYMVSHLVRSGMPKENILPLLQEMSILCDPLTITEDTRNKIDKSVEICINSKKNVILSQEIREFVYATKGVISATKVDRELNITTKCDKRNRSKILERLVSEGFLERYGKKSGCFRIVDKYLEVIDWEKDPGEEIDLILPLGLNKLVKIYPKNLIVIAGMSNAGKTALLLNIVGLNLDRFGGKINYFSSEMGACELKIRLEKFKLPKGAWKGCRFLERSDEFADVIGSDHINIIDYFEINDSFWKIGEDFKRIYCKLEKGIAIIAIQKHPEKDEGSGGRFSKEKPRLYLSLNEIGDYNELKIVKGKNWRDQDVNPNGLIKDFKIRDGYQLIELGNWHRRSDGM